jgi:hypothetical protein
MALRPAKCRRFWLRCLSVRETQLAAKHESSHFRQNYDEGEMTISHWRSVFLSTNDGYLRLGAKEARVLEYS